MHTAVPNPAPNPAPLTCPTSTPALGSVKNSDLPIPPKCCGHGSLYKLWHYLKPYDTDPMGGTSGLSDKWFMVYFTVTAWAIVATVGLGSEVTMGHTLMQYIASHEAGIVLWHLAQVSCG